MEHAIFDSYIPCCAALSEEWTEAFTKLDETILLSIGFYIQRRGQATGKIIPMKGFFGWIGGGRSFQQGSKFNKQTWWH